MNQARHRIERKTPSGFYKIIDNAAMAMPQPFTTEQLTHEVLREMPDWGSQFDELKANITAWASNRVRQKQLWTDLTMRPRKYSFDANEFSNPHQGEKGSRKVEKQIVVQPIIEPKVTALRAAHINVEFPANVLSLTITANGQYFRITRIQEGKE